MIGWLTLVPAAFAQVAPECEDAAAAAPPDWYVDDQHQQDYLLNFFALATTLSPLHGPVPVEPGHGSIGIELSLIPPLSCDHRLVLNRSKTEDTNKAPLLPRPRALFALPKVGPFVIYGGLGYVPPVTVFGTRNVIASGEIGAGVPMKSGLQVGARYHYTLMKTVAEIATPFVAGDPAVLDFYAGSTFGADVMVGFDVAKAVTPYLSVGYTDVSTFFYIGDDGVVGNNLHPYAGPAFSLGAQSHWKRIDLAAELYAAPVSFAATDGDAGHLYTGRLRVAYRI
jgi:hypothetical protein